MKPLPKPPAAGQATRLPGVDRDAALHDQLYRYAEDLQHMIESRAMLEARYERLRQTCEGLMESRAMLDNLIYRSSDIHLITDTAGTILYSNPAASIIAPQHRLAGRRLADCVSAANLDDLQSMMREALSGEAIARPGRELALMGAREGETALIVTAQAMPVSQAGQPDQIHWVLRDITHLRETEFETQISSMVFRNTAEAVMITDIAGDILAVNPAFTRITGYRADEVIGRNPRLLKSGIQGGQFYADFWSSLREHGAWAGEIYNRRKGGEVYPEWLTISPARDGEGNIISYIAVFSDLSGLLQAERRLAYLAHHDSLTGLPNRLLFEDRLVQAIAQSKRNGTGFTLIFIDLDRFKPINDTHGHAVGDEVLREMAVRLGLAVREADTVARFGGDEFVILAPMLGGAADIGQFCQKILQALSVPVEVDGHELNVGASFGCAEFPLDGEDEKTLLAHADAAMYRAKAAGGNRHAIHPHPDADGNGPQGA